MIFIFTTKSDHFFVFCGPQKQTSVSLVLKVSFLFPNLVNEILGIREIHLGNVAKYVSLSIKCDKFNSFSSDMVEADKGNVKDAKNLIFKDLTLKLKIFSLLK